MKNIVDGERLIEFCSDHYVLNNGEELWAVPVDDINDAPEEDFAIVKHAHWIYSGDEDDYDGYYRNCSFCGHQDYVYTRDNDRNYEEYCPCCGAMMDEDSKNDG